MYDIERQEEIQKLLQERGSMTVHRIAELLHVSESTVRRDLRALDERGKVRRTFGGAVPVDILTREVPLMLRENVSGREKQAIAAKAVRFIRDGEVLFLDASSTVLRLVPLLSRFKDLTVITNGPKTALELGKQKIRTICTGGLLLDDSMALVGSDAEDVIRRFNADAMFFSCRGMTEEGMLNDSSMEESHLRRIMLEHVSEKYFLCTRDKIGCRYLYNVIHRNQITDVVIQDVGD
ncbi:MAG TPA: DeoR/GlpR family DNA-binding transcription regulator [Oscillospiraceae bacterium]|nr:DeoR/GlpR family DNA-binding transcription regulator [Oscillospiraceae bacterium]HPF56975.1 DeoR/GlpR family DNA-binding transcription regulator [Clostridiales bacterium]HPK35672.1 DeoR/GlpR family DNA-binding transcription regulator [Oscillospiraceae bacterium]HPR75790.1 DeoR/GlpR family DNA-binding transcription regulator [Oscillospiraceae bacterium]